MTDQIKKTASRKWLARVINNEDDAVEIKGKLQSLSWLMHDFMVSLPTFTMHCREDIWIVYFHTLGGGTRWNRLEH
jgi:hypothetical protein